MKKINFTLLVLFIFVAIFPTPAHASSLKITSNWPIACYVDSPCRFDLYSKINGEINFENLNWHITGADCRLIGGGKYHKVVNFVGYKNLVECTSSSSGVVTVSVRAKMQGSNLNATKNISLNFIVPKGETTDDK